MVLVMQDRFARQFDLVAFFADTLNHDLLAFLQFIAHVANATISDLDRKSVV